jgi:hypothetical protein
VSASQRESRFRVVKCGRQPASGCVAGATILSELTVMVVVFGMAGIAILRCAFEDIVDVTIRAAYRGVLTQQLERSLVMIESRLFPILRDMAFTAILPKLAIMGVVFGMAGRTILGSGLQISDIFRALMAASA